MTLFIKETSKNVTINLLEEPGSTLTVSIFQNGEEDRVLGAQWTAQTMAPRFNFHLSSGLPSTSILVIDTTSLNSILTSFKFVLNCLGPFKYFHN